MSLFNIKQTDPVTDADTIGMYAHALNAWIETLDDPSVEFTLMGLKLFENINGFFPETHELREAFLKSLNEFILSWPSKEELERADAMENLKAAIEQVARTVGQPGEEAPRVN